MRKTNPGNPFSKSNLKGFLSIVHNIRNMCKNALPEFPELTDFLHSVTHIINVFFGFYFAYQTSRWADVGQPCSM